MAFSKIAAENLGGSTLPALSGTNLTAISAGKVVQAVHYRESSDKRQQGDGVVHANINITPTSASNKILVLISATIEGAGSSGEYAFLYLRRNIGGSITTTVQIANAIGYQADGGKRHTISCNSLDECNTTSQVTYELYHDEDQGTNVAYDYYETNYTLLEIAT